MSKTTTASGLIAISGKCLICDETFTGNGTALAATRHYQATGHHVRVEQTTYWEKGGKKQLIQKKANSKKRRKTSKKKKVKR